MLKMCKDMLTFQSTAYFYVSVYFIYRMVIITLKIDHSAANFLM